MRLSCCWFYATQRNGQLLTVGLPKTKDLIKAVDPNSSSIKTDCMNTGTMAASGEESASLPENVEEEVIVEAEHISLCVCSSSAEDTVQELMTYLQTGAMKDYVGRVQFMRLPYNDLDSFRPEWSNYNAVILCHSIHNRRFSITDVVDALYDKFLPLAKSHFGPNKVFVIVHDFDWPMRNHKELYSTFKGTQPTTFQSAKSVYICGKLGNSFEMSEDDAKEFLDAMRFVHTHPALDQSPSLLQWIFDVCASIKDYILNLMTSVGALLGNAANSQQRAVTGETGLHTDCKDVQAELESAAQD